MITHRQEDKQLDVQPGGFRGLRHFLSLFQLLVELVEEGLDGREVQNVDFVLQTEWRIASRPGESLLLSRLGFWSSMNHLSSTSSRLCVVEVWSALSK